MWARRTALLLALGPVTCHGAHVPDDQHSLMGIGSLWQVVEAEGFAPSSDGDFPVRLATSFSAGFNHSFMGPCRGIYYADRHLKRNRQITETSSPIFGDKIVRFDQLNAHGMELGKNITLGRGEDKVCKPLPVRYTDPLGWIRFAKRNGTKFLDGGECTVFSLVIPYKGSFAFFEACIAADGAPRELNEFLPDMAIGTGANSYQFGNVTVGPQDPALFEVSPACEAYPTPLCKKHEQELNLYRVHGASEPPTLAMHNVGDSSGDMAYFCAFNAFKKLNGSLVTHWQVKVDSTFSQYSYCNFIDGKDSCMGGVPGTHIGRESALGQGQGPLQGQCSPNLDVGSWYSFPKGGQCPPGQPLGTDGCTWAEARQLRTVEAPCILRDRGLEKVCKEEFGHPPFVRSTRIFELALASSDPAKGGCPDAGPAAGLLLV